MKTIIIILIFTVLCGCSTINGLISPEQQCRLLKSGGKIGISYIQKQDAKISESSYNLIKTQIMPRLSGKQAENLKHDDLNVILDIVNKNFGYQEKVTIQNGVDMILAWTPSIKSISEKTSTWSQLINNIKCLFQGILDGFISSQMSIKTKITPVKNPNFQIKWKNSLK